MGYLCPCTMKTTVLSAGTVRAVSLRSCSELEHWQWDLAVFAAVAVSPSFVPGVPGNLDNTFVPVSRTRAPSSVPQQCRLPFYLGHLPGSRNRQGNSYVKLV